MQWSHQCLVKPCWQFRKRDTQTHMRIYLDTHVWASFHIHTSRSHKTPQVWAGGSTKHGPELQEEKGKKDEATVEGRPSVQSSWKCCLANYPQKVCGATAGTGDVPHTQVHIDGSRLRASGQAGPCLETPPVKKQESPDLSPAPTGRTWVHSPTRSQPTQTKNLTLTGQRSQSLDKGQR